MLTHRHTRDECMFVQHSELHNVYIIMFAEWYHDSNMWILIMSEKSNTIILYKKVISCKKWVMCKLKIRMFNCKELFINNKEQFYIL